MDLTLSHLFSCFKKKPKLSELLLNKVRPKKTRKSGKQTSTSDFYGSIKILSLPPTFPILHGVTGETNISNQK